MALVLTDRGNASNRWAVQVADGQLKLVSTGAVARSEPTVEDLRSPDQHYKLFVREGQLGIERVFTPGNERVFADDADDATAGWQVTVKDSTVFYFLAFSSRGELRRGVPVLDSLRDPRGFSRQTRRGRVHWHETSYSVRGRGRG
jgi:hypothetical protein